MTFGLKTEQPKLSKSIAQPDALIEGTLGGLRFIFMTEIKRYGSLKTVSEGIYGARQAAEAGVGASRTKSRMYPLVITPWLSDENLMLLENESVSGIDLCGNGTITLPGIVIRNRGS